MSRRDAGGNRGEGGAESRRTFVVLAAAGTCAIAATIGIPAALFVAAPLSTASEGSKRRVVAKLAALAIGVPTKVTIVGDEVDAWTRAEHRRLGAVWLLRTAEREVRALSVICPHLGCSVELADGGKGFACPCHDSAFDLGGTRTSGPSPRAMDALPVEVTESGDVAVVFKRFRIGVADREEVG
jgi:menaquinol-cytochrome c reductase iron-sulfur subunit